MQYIFVSCADGYVIDLYNGVCENGNKFQLWHSNGNNAQKFLVNDLGNGFTIQCVEQGAGDPLMLDQFVNDGTLNLYPAHGGENQRWEMRKTYGSKIKIQSGYNGKVLTSNGKGQTITVEDDRGESDADQSWIAIQVSQDN